MSDQNVFATLSGDGRVWAVGAVHGELTRLSALHAQLLDRFEPGDKLVYLGNYYGHGPAVRETIDALLLFRRMLLALPEVDCGDVVHLRGGQEEMWQKLLQLQFATNPAQVLAWMLDHGVDATVRAYGADPQEARSAAREGILSLTRWTSALRAAMRAHDGHVQLMSTLKHAAFTADETLLFVHAGLDPARPLGAQSDTFWWGSSAFAGLDAPYAGFRRVVRGYDRRAGGLSLTDFTATLDAGCGKGGPLVAACFDRAGQVLEMLEG